MLNVLLCVSSSTRRLRVCCWWPRWPCRSSARRRKRSASTHIHKQQIRVLLMLKWRSAGGINISADRSFCDYKCCCIFNCTSRHKHYITLVFWCLVLMLLPVSPAVPWDPAGCGWLWHPPDGGDEAGTQIHGELRPVGGLIRQFWIIFTQFPVFNSD